MSTKRYFDETSEMRNAIESSIIDSYDALTDEFILHPKIISAGYAIGYSSKNTSELCASIESILESNMDPINKLSLIRYTIKNRMEEEIYNYERVLTMFNTSGIIFDSSKIKVTKCLEEKTRDVQFD